MNEVLNLKRVWLLIRSDFIAEYRSLLLTSAAIAAVMLLASLLTVAQGGEAPQYYGRWYVGMLFIWGPIAASFSFRELHDKTKNEAYLTLPASALEKTAARLLRATIGFLVYLLIFLTLASAVIEGVNRLVIGRGHGVFNPLNAFSGPLLGMFLVVVSLYFLGAAWFRKLHFVKTALTLTAIPIALMFFAGFMLDMVFEQDFRTMSFGGDAFRNYYFAHQRLFDASLRVLGILCFVVLPIFCWWVAYLRVRETEVSHGV